MQCRYEQATRGFPSVVAKEMRASLREHKPPPGSRGLTPPPHPCVLSRGQGGACHQEGRTSSLTLLSCPRQALRVGGQDRLHQGLRAPSFLPGGVTMAFVKAWMAPGGPKLGGCLSTPLGSHSAASLGVPLGAASWGVTRCPPCRPVSAAASTVAFCSECQVGGSTRQQPPHVPTRWRPCHPKRTSSFASGIHGHQVP